MAAIQSAKDERRADERGERNAAPRILTFQRRAERTLEVRLRARSRRTAIWAAMNASRTPKL